jgi:hypothetical protein
MAFKEQIQIPALLSITIIRTLFFVRKTFPLRNSLQLQGEKAWHYLTEQIQIPALLSITIIRSRCGRAPRDG